MRRARIEPHLEKTGAPAYQRQGLARHAEELGCERSRLLTDTHDLSCGRHDENGRKRNGRRFPHLRAIAHFPPALAIPGSGIHRREAPNSSFAARALLQQLADDEAQPQRRA